MGLSICRSIIDAHGGRLWAETNEPRGAVFQFTLPTHEFSELVDRKSRPKTPHFSSFRPDLSNSINSG